jgi:hypothetical protein
MQIKTVEQVINDQSSYKPASLYNAIVRSIKDGPLSGKAIPLNRNDPNSKFRLAKAVARGGRSAHREVTNFVILDMAAFEAWFDASKAGIRTTRALNRTQVVMPRLEDIVSGQYTPEQLSQLAEHVASRRYGSHRSGGRAAKNAAAKSAAKTAAAKTGAPKTGAPKTGAPKTGAPKTGAKRGRKPKK